MTGRTNAGNRRLRCCTGPSQELTGQSSEPRHGSCKGAVAVDERDDLGHHTPGFGESVIGGRIAE